MTNAENLDTWLQALRKASRSLVSLDGQERWGMSNATDEDRAAFQRDVDEQNALYRDSQAQLEALVARLRIDAPAELDAWIAARIARLQAVVATLDLTELDGRVTKTEIEAACAQWEEVRTGPRTFVDENTSWVPL